MPVTIVVPQLGESVVEGTVGKWLKKEGEPIAKDEPIVEIITDKINIELPAPAAGTLGKITVPEGTVAQVGQQLGVILQAGESLSAGAQAAPAGGPQPGARPPAPGQPPAPAREPAPARAGTAVAEAPSGDDQRVSPAVRKLLRENSLDLSSIRGSGMGGRVTREDVLNHIEAGRIAASAGAGAPAPQAAPGSAPGRAPAAAPPKPLKPIPAPAFAPPGSREEVVQPLTNVRKKIAENMLRSRHSAAHCSTWDEVDMTALVEMRARLKERIKSTYGVNLTYMPFIMKAVVRALREFPILNASMTETEVHYKKFYNIGVAVHRDQGLIVPVVHDADRKTLLQLAQEIEDLGHRARADKLTLNDIQGGTFTITNAGMFGATASTPIINYPEVGVLGVHLIQERPVVRDHRIVIRNMMTLVLSFDHRLVDGTPAVQFLHRVKELLEDAESWLLDSI
ncbi:MAG: dihydrolipoyllysine-residue succinyltransferase [Candidatus Eisenbacteria bacterium]|uniref:Dihydrolipoyllysine-residue succinyltransferase component of 2-oxoglutarate dehydrogenase complex n=1 Tax=Eiseniibacteriota bacterium TaxID=2212470 RepID=A0A538T4K3_UNCEI|nr:MAG: dihydrolipoyllysine-residue succinyltransferase [Candidatus Eisenbacteria bacterium]